MNLTLATFIYFLIDSENETVELVVKRKKIQCTFCLGIFNQQSVKKHEVKCENIQKLIENDKTCGICKKTFGSRQALNQHIGTNHKEALLQLEKKT